MHTNVPFQLPHQGRHPGAFLRVLAEASEQMVDSALRKNLVDQTDESEQILFEQCRKEAHQGFTRGNEKRGTRHVRQGCLI